MRTASVRSPWTVAVALAVVSALSAVGLVPLPASAQADGADESEAEAAACEGRSVPEAGFTDSRPNVHADAIDCVAWYGIAQGLTATRYGPTVRVNRAQMASFVARLVEAGGGELAPAGDQGFRDVDASGVHAYAINRLATAGVVRGTDATSYAPEAKVRRDQMASFLARVLERFAADGNALQHLDPAGDAFVLRPDGYASVQLGDPAYDVVSQTAARLGPPTHDRTAECPSGSDRQVSWDGLYVIFADGVWQGYAVQEGTLGATEAGIEVGDTVAALRSAYPDVELAERTLGPEWFVDFGGDGFLSGFLTGLDEDDQVTMVSAGDKCVFR